MVDATQIAAFATSSWTPPSSDPSGITFVPGKGLLISDAEVEETIALSQPTNLFYSTLAGVNNGAADDGSTVGWSNEPTGVFYVAKAGNPWNGHLFVTDDDQKRVYDIASAGADGRFGTADDGSRTFFKPTVFGNTDPEDVAFDSTHNELWIAGGLSTIVSRVNPGADNNFATAGDNVTKNFELPHLDPDPLKPPSPEGMAYDPARGHHLRPGRRDECGLRAGAQRRGAQPDQHGQHQHAERRGHRHRPRVDGVLTYLLRGRPGPGPQRDPSRDVPDAHASGL